MVFDNFWWFLFRNRIPVSIRGNTNAAAMMVGEKGADLVKEDNGDPVTWPDDGIENAQAAWASPNLGGNIFSHFFNAVMQQMSQIVSTTTQIFDTTMQTIKQTMQAVVHAMQMLFAYMRQIFPFL